eukprot:GHVS01020796.1.p1 GENE.GHVS01020796.1~~GHVS01020796.1.p1  ORF type:complete len:409 (+),score=54.63 GHVS01020796.1:57-1283(+)
MAWRYVQLSRDLRKLDDSLRPLRAQYKWKDKLISGIRPLLEKATGGELHTFGSCENGFWTKCSDVDACLVIANCYSKPAQISKIELVKKQLIRHEQAQKVLVVRAQVPIAKIKDEKTCLTLCDISINNTAALHNSLLSGTLSRIDPRVRPLGRFIKYWATARHINDRSMGSLSTYTLLLQLFYFLQATSPPVLPLYRDIELLPPVASSTTSSDETDMSEDTPASGVATGAARCGEPQLNDPRKPPFVTDVGLIQSKIFEGYSKNKQSLGELIVEFFRLFGDDRFRGGESGVTVEVYDGRERPNNLGVLACICPLTKKNVNPFMLAVWQQLHEEFARARDLLDSGCSLEKLCEPRILPPSCSAKVHQQLRKAKILARKAGLLSPKSSKSSGAQSNCAATDPTSSSPKSG